MLISKEHDTDFDTDARITDCGAFIRDPCIRVKIRVVLDRQVPHLSYLHASRPHISRRIAALSFCFDPYVLRFTFYATWILQPAPGINSRPHASRPHLPICTFDVLWLSCTPCDQTPPPLVLLDRAPRRKEIDAETVFNALFIRYEQPLCSYLARLTGSTAQAQELAQETFIRAYRAILRGEEWDNPRAWLYRAASRLAIDAYRRRRLLQWLPLSERDPDPGPGVERADDSSAVQAALHALPLPYRIPLVLYSCEEYSVAEVAETLGLSLSAVKMRLSRAREMFRQAYRPEGETLCRSPRLVEDR